MADRSLPRRLPPPLPRLLSAKFPKSPPAKAGGGVVVVNDDVVRSCLGHKLWVSCYELDCAGVQEER